MGPERAAAIFPALWEETPEPSLGDYLPASEPEDADVAYCLCGAALRYCADGNGRVLEICDRCETCRFLPRVPVVSERREAA